LDKESKFKDKIEELGEILKRKEKKKMRNEAKAQ
jgi:hypothetical protein